MLETAAAPQIVGTHRQLASASPCTIFVGWVELNHVYTYNVTGSFDDAQSVVAGTWKRLVAKVPDSAYTKAPPAATPWAKGAGTDALLDTPYGDEARARDSLVGGGSKA